MTAIFACGSRCAAEVFTVRCKQTNRSKDDTSALIWYVFFFKEIYCPDSIHSVYKDKLQNCFCKQFE